MATRTGLIRPGGRGERIKNAVVSAILGLAEAGDVDLNVEKISRISGVHKSTIYRRWPSRVDLLAAVLEVRSHDLVIEPADDWQAYLLNLAIGLRDFYSAPIEIALTSILVASDSSYASDVRKIWAPLAEKLLQPIRDAQRRGELSPGIDADILFMLISGSIIGEIMITRLTPSDTTVRQLVSYVIHGVAGSGAGTGGDARTKVAPPA
jgi:AcrR family transcriptional regulator